MLVYPIVLYQLLRGLPLLQLNIMLGTHADFRQATEVVSGKFSLSALTLWLLSGRSPTFRLSKVSVMPLKTFGE